MSNEETERAVYWALEAGYRHIDSAEWSVLNQYRGPYIVSHDESWIDQVRE